MSKHTILIGGLNVYNSPFVASKEVNDTTIYINVSMDYSPAANHWFPISETGNFVSIEGLFAAVEEVIRVKAFYTKYPMLPKPNICVFCRAGRNRSKLVIACLDLLKCYQDGDISDNFGMRGVYWANSVNGVSIKTLEDVLLQFTDRPFKASEAVEIYYDLIGK